MPAENRLANPQAHLTAFLTGVGYHESAWRRYAEPVTAKGFVFMDTPGYDPVSATGQVAGGANVIAFTTGRGSAFGCKPTPSIKLATNSDMYRPWIDDMDINCGDVLDGVTIDEKGREIFDKILAVASGERSKSEDARLRRRRVRALADRRDDVTATTGAALLFDLDGTLIDSDASAPARVPARLRRARRRRSIKQTYDTRIHGADNSAIGRDFLPHLSEAEQAATLAAKEERYREDLGAVERDRRRRRAARLRRGARNAPRRRHQRAARQCRRGARRARPRRAPAFARARPGARALQARSVALSDRAAAARRRGRPLGRVRGLALGPQRGEGRRGSRSSG